MINKNVNFECISIAKHIINLFNVKLNVKCIRNLVRKSYTPVVPIANTCSIGYPHDSRADNAAYRHDRRADNAAYRHDRRADSLSRKSVTLTHFRSKLRCAFVFLIFVAGFSMDIKIRENNNQIFLTTPIFVIFMLMCFLLFIFKTGDIPYK